ncbi:ubiquitin carboxyl-terminal hydrolase [Physcia stellaris]|nr:ubiquitin carboxyl-terminal hydrolase [Physcia stellaris]
MLDYEGKAGQSYPYEDFVPRRKPSFGAKVKAYFKRFWWLYLIFLICAILIIVLCLVYVAFPRMAQAGINDSRLQIQSVTLSDPTPNSFHLEQTAVAGNSGNYHPRLDAFNASLSLDGSEKDVPYAYITLPAIHASKTTTIRVNQTVQITDLAAFNEYNAALLGSASVKICLKGRTKLHEMRFPTTTVDFDKVVTMKGLNALTGFAVTDFSIKPLPDPDGTNMLGTISIPNPTAMTLTLGTVTFDNYIGGTQILIGNTTMTDLIIEVLPLSLPLSLPLPPLFLTNIPTPIQQPGTTLHPLRSKINQSLVLAQLVKNYRDGKLPIDIVATGVVYDGVHIPYFEMALGRSAVRVVLDVGAKLKEAGIDFLEGGGRDGDEDGGWGWGGGGGWRMGGWDMWPQRRPIYYEYACMICSTYRTYPVLWVSKPWLPDLHPPTLYSLVLSIL